MNDASESPPIKKERLGELIQTLRPDRRMFAGRTFFQYLLLSDGPEGVMAFLEKAADKLDKQGELEISDFSDDNGELDAFKKCREKFMTRRFMLGVVGEGFGGAALGVYGLLGVGHQLTNAATGNADPKQEASDIFEEKQHQWDKGIMPTAYTAIGAGMVYLSGKNLRENKLGDVANAVERLAQKIEREQTAQRA